MFAGKEEKRSERNRVSERTTTRLDSTSKFPRETHEVLPDFLNVPSQVLEEDTYEA